MTDERLARLFAELNVAYWVLVRPIVEKAERAIALERAKEEIR